MDNTASAEQLARAWDHYVEVSRRYVLAQRVSDAAEAAHAVTYRAVEAAHAEEVRWARAVRSASQAFVAASDTAFMADCGISPVGLGEDRERSDQ